VQEIAYAKLNLALHVRLRRGDGYHELETLFAFMDQGDRLSVAPATGFTLTITGPFAAGLSTGGDNLVLRAAQALAQRFGVSAGAAFVLDKQLPVAAGIGGGSADAAAALRLCARLWSLAASPAELAALAVPLGADVPACVAAQTCFGSGVGDKLARVAVTDLAGAPVLLVNPRIACPTGPVFKAWDGIDRGALDPADWLNGRNDLAVPAIGLHPEIATVLAALRAAGPRVARMSGSGATCFALFIDPAQRDAAAVQLAERHPHWWQMSGALR
jgi:4-diphosphocytidyl-2-C-methyl-D-erythritol kinase